MNAKKVLELLSTENYTELKRLAEAEIMQSKCATSSEKSIAKAFVKLSKQAAEEKYRLSIAGAYYKDDFLCVTNGYWGVMTKRIIGGCFMREDGDYSNLDLYNIITGHKLSRPETIMIDNNKIAQIKNAFAIDKANGDSREPAIKIYDTYIKFNYFINIYACMEKNCVLYVQKNEYIKPVLFEDDNTMAIILPLREINIKMIEKSFNIKEYEV